MSKIICEICGTTYPDTAECCPICGCPKEAIEYGRKSKGKPRYQCPKYEG